MALEWIPLSEPHRLPAVCGLYLIRHRESGKEYVGKSVNIRRRLSAHRRGVSGAKYLLRAIRASGAGAFECAVYATGTDAEMLALEVRVIAERGTLAPGGFNLTVGGEGATGWKMTPEQLEKSTAAARGRVRSAETRARMADANRNRPKEHWVRVAAATRARGVSAETRQKMSEAARSRSAETLAKIGEANTGRVASAETRARMRAAQSRAILVWLPGHFTPAEFSSCDAAAEWAGKNPASISNYANGKTRAPCGTLFAYAK